MTGFVYFTKRNGWRWEVWHRYADGRAEKHSGLAEWRLIPGVRFWRKRTADRVALALQRAFADGDWGIRSIYLVEDSFACAALHPHGR